MRTNLIIVDDFYNNVDEVRKFALSQPFDVKGNYPGVRTGCLINDSTRENIQKIVEPHGGKITDWLESDKDCLVLKLTSSFKTGKVLATYKVEGTRYVLERA